jgi:two-component system sensor histidine kinase PilS (NtrC family)
MTHNDAAMAHTARAIGPFLPLALRFAASFSLLVIHMGIEMDMAGKPAGESIYVFFLGLIFVESGFESARSTLHSGSPFAVPSRPWILLNIFLLCFLVTLLVAFHGVGKPGFAALYVFPVLASAFYLGTAAIIGVGAVSAAMYAFCVIMFSNGYAPPFGFSGIEGNIQPPEQVWLIAFTSLQVSIATLVVAAIRKRLETLGATLSESAAAADEISALYRNVVESMNSGLVTTDLKGVLTSANPSAERILQSRLQLGHPFKMLDGIELAMRGAALDIRHDDWAFTAPDGTEKMVGSTISPLMNSDNKQTGFLILFEDMTDIKAMEAKMLLSERLAAIGELSAELAHEMRTPLASIQGCIQILKMPNSDGAIMNRAMTILARESERVGAVVSDFLELAKPRGLKAEPIWMPDLLEEVRATWDTDPRFSGLPLEIEAPPKVWINGDPLACHQILTNLLSNSSKAVQGRPAPFVRIAHKTNNDNIELTIADNGRGMDKSRINNIFEPFQSGFSHGIGIGMSLVFQLTQRMDWKISVSSQVDVGTEIRLAIPIEQKK